MSHHQHDHDDKSRRPETTPATDERHPRLGCRLHLHHSWHVVSSEEGTRWRECRHCGKEFQGGKLGMPLK